MPKNLSICIPSYNRPLWLGRALESIIAQNVVDNIEIIVSDDSSKQDSYQVTQKLLQDWSGKWQYQANQPRLGMTDNWNHAIRLASGEHILILHDDDFLLSDSLQTILEILEKYSIQYPVFLFGVNVVDEREKVLKKQIVKQQYLSPKQASSSLLSNSSFVRFPAIVVQRRVFEEVGYFNPVWGEPTDIDMWLRIFSRYGVFCCPQVTCAYRVHSQALTMGVFNKKTIGTLMSIFAQVNILDKIELEKCKATFFHQFILAGAFRKLRRGQFQEFTQIMELFNLEELRGLKCPLKWLVFRYGFGFIVRLLPSFS